MSALRAVAKNDLRDTLCAMVNCTFGEDSVKILRLEMNELAARLTYMSTSGSFKGSFNFE